MNSNRIQILSEIIVDFFAITISFLVQYWFRFHSGLVPSTIIPDFQVTVITYGFILVYWYLILIFMGMYKNWYELSPIEEIWGVLKSVFLGTLIIVTLVYSTSSSSPRLMFLSYLLIFSLVISLGRYSNRLVNKRLRAKGIIKIPIIIVGDMQSCTNFYHECRKSLNWGYSPVAFIISDEKFDKKFDENNTTIPTFSNLHKMSSKEFEDIVKQFNPEIIVLMKSLRKNYETLMAITNIAEDINVRIKIEPDLYDAFTGQTQARNLWGIPLIEINTEIIKPYQRFLKRSFDIIFSLLVIIIGFPIWFIVGLLVKLTSKGPVFFVQNRVGKDGKVFKMYKFRSMTTEQNPRTPKWTSVNDPRVTPFGRFIRKSHLDEIPQFWNALIGDMSVVGPRPEQPHFVEEFTKAIPQYARRHKVRPGLTGWWQVKYTPYELSIDEIKNRLKDDFYYIENYSFKLDMEIVIRTVWLVIKGHGQT